MNDEPLIDVVNRLEEKSEKVQAGESLTKREYVQLQEDLERLREELMPLVESMLHLYMVVFDRLIEAIEDLPPVVQEELKQIQEDSDE